MVVALLVNRYAPASRGLRKSSNNRSRDDSFVSSSGGGSASLDYYHHHNSDSQFQQSIAGHRKKPFKATAFLTSLASDFDVISDWLFLRKSYHNEHVYQVQREEGEASTPPHLIPPLLLWATIFFTLLGTLMWLILATDGRMIMPATRWLGYDKLSIGHVLFLCVLLEDIPQVILTFLIEDYYEKTALSNLAVVNVTISIYDSMIKLAEAYDERHDIVETGQWCKESLWAHHDVVTSILSLPLPPSATLNGPMIEITEHSLNASNINQQPLTNTPPRLPLLNTNNIMKTTMTNISDLANYIHSPDCKSIAFLTGAGVSVASGIPDFRSPGGMYDTLRPELLTCNEFERNLMKIDPTHVVNWDMFKNNAFPYLEVRRPFILGTRNRQWKATIAHQFAELLHKKTEKLTRVYTCNIDGLYGQCNGIPDEKIVNVHGSLDKISCEGCGRGMDYDEFCNTVAKNIKDIYGIDLSAPKESSPVLCPACNNPLVKPSTVLFGRSLSDEFWSRTEQDLPHVDLLIIAGTSLVIAPANSLVYTVPKTCRRVVVNLNEVGKGLGLDYSTTNDERQSDLFLQGGCDEIFLQLIQELGWVESLDIDCLPKASAKMVIEAREKIKNIA